MINATKVNGACWDLGCDEAKSRDASQAVAAAAAGLVAAPYLAVAAALAPSLGSAISRPDTIGWVYVHSGGAFSPPVHLSQRGDSFTPQWGLHDQGVSFHVPLTPDTSLRVELVDADMFDDDDIGIVAIGAAELEKALASHETYQVNVSQQTQGQVAFVGITVISDG